MNDFYCSALFECYYDVLNHIAIGSILAPGRSYEVNLATQLLDSTHENDLHIYDRHYASYEFLATLTQRHKNYLIRCPYRSFKEINSLVRDTQNWSKVVVLCAPKSQRNAMKEKGLPLEITVRFISVILSTGELEILVTSLMDSSIERQEFRWLYGKRWEVETFYSLLKGRLCLENFTGKSAEAVKQDCWSTIFISNFETLMTEGTEEEMNAQLQPGCHAKKVNTAVSFNTIKNLAFELFMDKGEPQKAMDKMMLLFKTNPGLERVGREPQKRKKTSDLQSRNFQKRGKKYVF